jgi:hypothetical protein
MTSKTFDIRKQAYSWQALSIMVAFLLVMYLIGDRFSETVGILPQMNLSQQLSVFFLSMLSPIFWVKLIAPMCYLSVAIAASTVFGRIAKGDDFSPTLLRGLNDMGSNLMFGACAAIFLTPTLVEWLHFRGGFKFQSSTESFVILIVGGALFFIANIGAKISAELNEIV